MTRVNQMLREWARTHGNPPYWIVEKDYALSYLLAAVMHADSEGGKLLLKGGTALKKAYFADYRFSEDLDFSIQHSKRLDAADSLLGTAVAECERMLQERGAFLVDWTRLELKAPHPGGQDAYIVRVQFPGQRQPLCRLKVEITHDELVLWPPADHDLLHVFPEDLSVRIRCYSLEEIVTEKLRALLQSRQRLWERGWGASRVCRDYYDLWYILGQQEVTLSDLTHNLVSKCRHRGVSFESATAFFDPILVQVAEREWPRQLVPFVRDCPVVELVLGDLQGMVQDLLR